MKKLIKDYSYTEEELRQIVLAYDSDYIEGLGMAPNNTNTHQVIQTDILQNYLLKFGCKILVSQYSKDRVLAMKNYHGNIYFLPIEKLYEYCKIAREILVGKHGVGRVIARPFNGTYPEYKRTPRRHDFSLEPPKDTVLDELKSKGYSAFVKTE